MTEDVLTAVADMIREVMGDDLEPDETITRATSFADDLELESIEFVALAEQIQARWGDRVDFDAWIAGQGLDDIIALKVGDLVAYVEQCLSST